MLTPLLAAALALQPAPAPPASPADAPSAPPPASLEELAVDEAAALRCSVAFALVSAWQREGDARGAQWPGLAEQGGREFFVRTMAQLMDRRGLDRQGVLDLVALQTAAFEAAPDEVAAIMPACLLMKAAAGV
jgi:hypothetical protein